MPEIRAFFVGKRLLFAFFSLLAFLTKLIVYHKVRAVKDSDFLQEMCYSEVMKMVKREETTVVHEIAACKNTPVGRAIELLGDTWILLIVMNLLDGPMRFNTLRATLGRISSKTLSQRLKGLEELGFVQREAFLEIPPRVEYCLTQRGLELSKVIEALETFGERHLSDEVITMSPQCEKAGVEDGAEIEDTEQDVEVFTRPVTGGSV
jgi:DNA-binding HxlR family transcriptional regulator